MKHMSYNEMIEKLKNIVHLDDDEDDNNSQSQKHLSNKKSKPSKRRLNSKSLPI